MEGTKEFVASKDMPMKKETNETGEAVNPQGQQAAIEEHGPEEQSLGAVGGVPAPTSRDPGVNAWVQGLDSKDYGGDPFIVLQKENGQLRNARSTRPRPLSAEAKEYWASQKMTALKKTLDRVTCNLYSGSLSLDEDSGRQAKKIRSSLLLDQSRIERLEREIKTLSPVMISSLLLQIRQAVEGIGKFARQAEEFITASMTSSSLDESTLQRMPLIDQASVSSRASSVAKDLQQMDTVRASLELKFQNIKEAQLEHLEGRRKELERQCQEADAEVVERQKAAERQKEKVAKEIQTLQDEARKRTLEYNAKKELAIAVAFETLERNNREGKPILETLQAVDDFSEKQVKVLDEKFRENLDLLKIRKTERPNISETEDWGARSRLHRMRDLQYIDQDHIPRVHFHGHQTRDSDDGGLGGPEYYSTPNAHTQGYNVSGTTGTGDRPQAMSIATQTKSSSTQQNCKASTPMTLIDMNTYVGSVNSSDISASKVHECQLTEKKSSLHCVSGNQQTKQPSAMKNEDLPMLLCDVMNRQNLPKQTIPVFSGDPLKYKSWISAFELLIGSQRINPSQKLIYLQQYLAGEALSSVEGCLILHTESSYEEALAVLKRRFGHHHTIAQAFRNKMDQWPSIGASDVKALREYSDFLNQVRKASKDVPQMPGMSIFEDIHYIKGMVGKLPQHQINKWIEQAQSILEDQGRDPNFKEFAEFVTKRANVMSNPVFGNMKTTSKKSGATSYFVSGLSPSLKGEDSASQKKQDQGNRGGLKTVNQQPLQEQQDNREAQQSQKHEPKGQQTGQGNRRRFNNSRSRVKCYHCGVYGDHFVNECPDLSCLDELQRCKLFEDKGLCVTCGYVKHGNDIRCSPRCRWCKERHFTYLHSTQSSSYMASLSYAASSTATPCFARIMPVKVSTQREPSKSIVTLAFLDEGSDRSFATDDLVDQLNISKLATTVKSATLFHETSIPSFAVSGLTISPLDREDWLDMPTVLTVKKVNMRHEVVPTKQEMSAIPNLQDYARYFPNSEEIEHLPIGLLIARDIPEALKPQYVSESSQPYVVKSALGWGVVGATRAAVSFNEDDENLEAGTFLVEMTPEQFLDQMEKDFDEIPGDKISQQDQRFVSILKTGIHVNSEGHYEMPLPFKKDVPNISVNNNVALRRLNALKRKFNHDQNYQRMYCLFMANLIENRDCELVPEEELNNYPRYYIPHHGVVSDKKPGKVRVVFDCSAKTNGSCLNDHLLQGPDQLNSLIGVLCRFRKHQVAFACDVERMFHMFHVIPRHRDYLRFFWWPQGDVDSQPQEYRMRVHIFGAVSSPGCATYGLRQIANDHAEGDPQAAKFLREDFYVDDGLGSREDIPEASAVLKGAVDMCHKGKLRLHKIVSNEAGILEQFPSSELSGESVTKLTGESCEAKERTLGLVWDINGDRLHYHLNSEVGDSTRRGMLSTVAAIYDPLGFVAPYVLKGRLLVQEMCRDGLAWDDLIPSRLEKEWETWTGQLLELRELSIPRCFVPAGFGPVIETQVHHFSDASNVGYGQCTYLRLTNAAGQTNCTLVCAKARVVPIKKPTIPRLELQAAVLSVKASRFVKTHLQIKPTVEIFWTDSQIVIAYLRNVERRFHTFVAHRVNEILTHSTVDQWLHVETDQNPADHASRGLSVEGLTTSNWFSGPEFLKEREVTCSSQEEFTIREDDTECYMSNTTETTEVFGEDFVRQFSTLQKARRVLGILESRAAARHGRQLSVLESHRTAEITMIRAAQKEFLSDKTSKPLLQGLEVIRDERDVLRVKGRLANAPDEILRQPIVLPRKAHLTKLIVRAAHQAVGHAGRVMTSNEVTQQGYYVIGQRKVCQEVVNECTTCRRLQAVPLRQKMADLPQVRLEGTAPFENIGVDCFGPFFVYQGRRNVKRYGLMCTCLSSRAVHIEVLDDMTTSSFILALRNIISLRGNVKKIYCDRGTNFIGASREFKKAFKELDPSEVERFLAEKSCEFHFSPANASHMGGVWERQIRTARRVLGGLLKSGKEKLTPTSLRTLFYEAAAIVNGRPYSAMAAESPDVCEPLTPNHLLTLKSVPILPPPGDFSEDTEFTKQQWCIVQRYVERFWTRWKAEYLASLHKRQKWQRTHRNLEPGDVVIVHDDDQPRNRWKLGLVECVRVSEDGRVRSVELRQAPPCDRKGKSVKRMPTITRPIQKLSLLVATDS